MAMIPDSDSTGAIDRREFVKTSATAFGVTAVGLQPRTYPSARSTTRSGWGSWAAVDAAPAPPCKP